MGSWHFGHSVMVPRGCRCISDRIITYRIQIFEPAPRFPRSGVETRDQLRNSVRPGTQPWGRRWTHVEKTYHRLNREYSFHWSHSVSDTEAPLLPTGIQCSEKLSANRGTLSLWFERKDKWHPVRVLEIFPTREILRTPIVLEFGRQQIILLEEIWTAHEKISFN